VALVANTEKSKVNFGNQTACQPSQPSWLTSDSLKFFDINCGGELYCVDEIGRTFRQELLLCFHVL
jgi:hypothetical protein